MASKTGLWAVGKWTVGVHLLAHSRLSTRLRQLCTGKFCTLASKMSLAAMDAKTASTLECCTPGAVVEAGKGEGGRRVAESLGADCQRLCRPPCDVAMNVAGTCTTLLMSRHTQTHRQVSRYLPHFPTPPALALDCTGHCSLSLCVCVCVCWLQAKNHQTWPTGQWSSRRREISCEISMS